MSQMQTLFRIFQDIMMGFITQALIMKSKIASQILKTRVIVS